MSYFNITERTILIMDLSEGSLEESSSRALQIIADKLKNIGYSLVFIHGEADGLTTVKSEIGFNGIFISLGSISENISGIEKVITIIQEIRKRDSSVPITLTAKRGSIDELPIEIISEVREYIQLGEDSPDFIAGRIDFAIQQHNKSLLPPYFKALKSYAEDRPYYWDCPGHQGGVAYLKHPIGQSFLRFFGENIMRADIGIATPELGDWLEHLGPPGESERRTAKLFGADMTFYVTGGSSQSNQIVGHAVLQKDQFALVDRNCHKSVNHELTVTGARPVYFKPARNGFGIIGLIPPEQFKSSTIAKALKASPLKEGAKEKTAAYAVVTNCTYDGLIYDVNRITRDLAESVPRIKFDEAWYAYAKFHPLYQGRFAMGVDDNIPNKPTLFAVQSTHKMLAAFSSASMIHIKNSSRAPVDHDVFNQSFAMHGTTSPFYPIIASIDVASAMMEGQSGRTYLDDAITDAIDFRKAIITIANKFKQHKKENNWFFDVWQPKEVKVGSRSVPFEKVSTDVLMKDSSCWLLRSNQAWHGFGKIDDGYAMLDPIKVTITCPGVDAEGKISEFGIPAPVVTKFLDTRRIVPARNGDYNILLLFALGSTQGKWATFVEALLEFKHLYDTNASLEQVLPELAAKSPCYSKMTLQELCTAIHQTNNKLKIAKLSDAACSVEATPVLSPAQAYECLISNQTEKVRVKDMKGRIAGVMVTPYPPGIPVIMPGERVGKPAEAIVDYLLALQEFARHFPGFEHELQGIEIDEDGTYWVRCIKE